MTENDIQEGFLVGSKIKGHMYTIIIVWEPLRWTNGRMLAPHVGDEGSIPGQV